MAVRVRVGPRRRAVAAGGGLVLLFGLAAASLPGAAAASDGTAPDTSRATFRPTAGDYYLNYVDAQDERASDGREQPIGSRVQASRSKTAKEYDRKFTEGNPVAGRALAQLEAEAARTGKSPRELRYKKAGTTQVAKLLTILVEFNPAANDDFTGLMVPQAVFDDALTPDVDERACVPGTIRNGPVHNQIADPATLAHPDNNSMWVPDFSPEYYSQMLYSTTGLTERVRPDLRGPDGRPGIDLRGNSMHNLYLEMSKQAYTVDGQATPWVMLPHSEAWYGQDICQQVNGEWVPGASQDDDGHPGNPEGAAGAGIDAVTALAALDPAFPWADYDIEDVSDADGDGNLNEPDGVIDHLVLVHAGEDASGGGGAEGTGAIWAHSSAIVPGFEIPGTGIRISNYIMQPEDAGVGVFAHEYGHDLGLPDLYDVGSGGDSDVDFWDLMASGSHTGPIFQGLPVHMGIWDKFVLGWVDPKVLGPGDAEATVKVGQASRTPVGTEDGIRINLPDKQVTISAPHSGVNQWSSSNDQAWADLRLTRELSVPTGSDVRFWSWNSYSIEAEWDYGFIEVSTDGGATWVEQKVYDEAGTLVSTDDGYADPNGRLRDYGNKKYGLTGSSGGYRHDYVDLTPFAGQQISLRLRYATDAGFEEQGWFADDFSVTADGVTGFADDVEAGANGWTPTVGTFTDTTGAGWHQTSGRLSQPQYYLVEWRNLDGFDRGLQYAYVTNYSRDGAWAVQRVPYNAPGALIWYRDTGYGNLNLTLSNLSAAPSAGTKGALLLVDSHFAPLRRTGEAAEKDPAQLDNLPSRPQSSNVAFGWQRTYPFQECYEAPGEPFSAYCTPIGRLPGVTTFDDAQGWYPGVEYRPDLSLDSPNFLRDPDASVVIPSRGNAPYSTRVVDGDGNPLPSQYGTPVPDLGSVLGTGNPGDAGVAMGVRIGLVQPGPGNKWVTIRVRPPAS